MKINFNDYILTDDIVYTDMFFVCSYKNIFTYRSEFYDYIVECSDYRSDYRYEFTPTELTDNLENCHEFTFYKKKENK